MTSLRILVPWILGGLNAFYEGSRDADLVEYRSSSNHENVGIPGNGLGIDNRLSDETELSIVELECSDCLCEELWFRICSKY